MRRIWTSLALASALLLPLAACGQEAAEPEVVMEESEGSESMDSGDMSEMENDESGQAMTEGEAGDAEMAAGDEASDGASDEMSDEGAEASEEMAEDGAEPAVEVKTDLEATDPSTVQLASGQPQLVEFFAFW